MNRPPIVRPFEADEWRVYRQLRLDALTEAPDAFGSTLAWEQSSPESDWARRLRDGVASPTDYPVVAEARGRPCGLAWGRIRDSDPDTAHLYQMWVAPEHRGHGAGAALLEAVINWATVANARQLRLDVARDNTPAYRLYSEKGFVPVGDLKPLRPGSPVICQAMELALNRGTEKPDD